MGQVGLVWFGLEGSKSTTIMKSMRGVILQDKGGMYRAAARAATNGKCLERITI